MQGSYSLRLTDEQIDEVVRRYRDGDTVRLIAVAYNVSESVIRNALRLRAVAMRGTFRGYRYS